MKLKSLIEFCRSLPHTTEDVKWGNDLVFSIRDGRMFCVFGIEDGIPTGVSFKVDDSRFLEMTDRPQFVPAPYMARARWVYVSDPHGVPITELRQLIRRSYDLYVEKLPKRVQRELREANPPG